MSCGAWQEYLAAARRLDAVRRQSAAETAEGQAVLQTARAELSHIRQRLALQQRKWPAVGVAPGELVPAAQSTATQSTAAQLADSASGAVLDSPAAVLAALRHTRSVVDEADALVFGGRSPIGGLANLPPALRNLLVYGPLACLGLAVQLALTISTENPLLLLSGLMTPAIAFLLGFLMIGLVFPTPPATAATAGGKVDRTPVLGAAVCLASVVLLCSGLVTMDLLR